MSFIQRPVIQNFFMHRTGRNQNHPPYTSLPRRFKQFDAPHEIPLEILFQISF
jgi:hypothetical protein